MSFDLEVTGAGRQAQDALAQADGVESVTSGTHCLSLRVVDQAALVAAIVKAHSLGLTIVGVVTAANGG